MRTLLDSFVLSTTVEASAKSVSVSKNMAMRYRRILLRFVEKADEKSVLSGKEVHVDETYVTLYGLVAEKKMKGISSQKEGIAIGTNSDNRIYLKDIGAGHPISSFPKKTWQGYIAYGSRIAHDSLHGYRGGSIARNRDPKDGSTRRSQRRRRNRSTSTASAPESSDSGATSWNT